MPKNNNDRHIETILACSEAFERSSEAFINRATKQHKILKDLPEGVLNKDHYQSFGDLVVCASNLSFAIELNLKCLYSLLGLSLKKNTHDLHKLYNGLPENIKYDIEERYEKGRTTPTPVHASITIVLSPTQKALEWPDDSFESKRLPDVLERSKALFIEWRYIFEVQPMKQFKFEYLLLFFGCIAIRATIDDFIKKNE
jgi:hypothetical protein